MRVEKEIPAVQVWLRGTLSEDMRAEPGDEGHAAVWLRSHPARQGMRTMAHGTLASDSNGAFVLADEIALSTSLDTEAGA